MNVVIGKWPAAGEGRPEQIKPANEPGRRQSADLAKEQRPERPHDGTINSLSPNATGFRPIYQDYEKSLVRAWRRDVLRNKP